MKTIKKCTFFESKEPLLETFPKSPPVSIGYYFFFLEENPAQEQIWYLYAMRYTLTWLAATRARGY